MPVSDGAIQSLNTFIEAFNRRDKDGILSNLHFPLYTHSDGAEPVIIESADDFWRERAQSALQGLCYRTSGSRKNKTIFILELG